MHDSLSITSLAMSSLLIWPENKKGMNKMLMPSGFNLVAGPTRLELATSGVTGQRSNQLNYDPAFFSFHWLVGGTGIEPVTPGL